MDRTEHEYYINWIVANSTPFKYNDKFFFIKSPSREARFYAQEVFFDYYHKSIKQGVMDREEMFTVLEKMKLWDDGKEKLLVKMRKDIEDLKVSVFQNYANSPARRKIKEALKDTKDYINKLGMDKFIFEQNTAEGLANYAKYNFLIGASIYNNKGKPYWKTLRCWELPDNILNTASKKLMKFSLNDTHYRELARSDTWRGVWNARKNGNLFGKSTVDLSEQQKQLVFWSILYDNISQSSECPPDDVVEDDDAIDGWMILQRRKRKADQNKDTIESMMGEKIKNSQHVFVLAGEEDVDKVYEMNDMQGKISLMRRLKQIETQGTVPEAGMADTMQFLQMEINKKFGGV